ncbi:MAG: hypothetical protein GX333_08025 [Syntrophomonadaceae bacterium]|nr:hypothetical protein [Syntrophomonadaceae bacterium]
MFYEYQVTTMKDSNYIMTGFTEHLKWLRERGFCLNIDNYDNNQLSQTYHLELHGKSYENIYNDADIIFIFKHQMAQVLAEHIIDDWEDNLLWKEVVKTCKAIPNEEKREVYFKASNFMKNYNDNAALNMLVRYNRKNKLAHHLLDYIHNSKLMVLEGFINFCLADYLEEIRIAVDLAFEEYKNEQEYNEFVKLLRYFVDTQLPKSNEVNLLMANNGIFYLWDEEGVAIEDKYINYYLDDILLDDINLDDILISILITVAPRHIVLHNVSAYYQNEAVKAIQRVFDDKISFCDSCERCYKFIREMDRS